MSTLALSRYELRYGRGASHGDAPNGLVEDGAHGSQSFPKNPVGVKNAKRQGMRRGVAHTRIKSPYVRRHQWPKSGRMRGVATSAAEVPAPKAQAERGSTMHFVGMGVLCAVGAIASVQTGPFPLNFAVGAGLALLFVREAIKRRRRLRASTLSQE